MKLIHCIYCSAALDSGLSKEALEEILEQSRTNNAKAGITGILLFDSGAFFQVLEGGDEAVEALYARIQGDPRHHSVTKTYIRADRIAIIRRLVYGLSSCDEAGTCKDRRIERFLL